MSFEIKDDEYFMRISLHQILKEDGTDRDANERRWLVQRRIDIIRDRLRKEGFLEGQETVPGRNSTSQTSLPITGLIDQETHLALERRAKRLSIDSKSHSHEEYIRMRTQVVQAFTRWCCTLLGAWGWQDEPLNSGDTRVLMQPDIIAGFMDNELLIKAEEQPPVILRHDFAEGR